MGKGRGGDECVCVRDTRSVYPRDSEKDGCVVGAARFSGERIKFENKLSERRRAKDVA